MKKTRTRFRSSLRRPLPSATIEALRRVAQGEWHGIILMGWRTGQRLNEIARLRGQSLAQMALVWVLRDPWVTSALIGASTVQQVQENVAALDQLALSEEELVAIDQQLS